MKKWPTLDIYILAIFKNCIDCSIINFRNREDLNYTIEKIKEFFDIMSEDEWIDYALNNLQYLDDKVVRKDNNLSYYLKSAVTIKSL
jgi:hypothetical protein